MNQYILKIEKPCTENWNTMQSADTGKYCTACNKKVIDFTKLNNEQIINILSSSAGSLCGRLNEGQLFIAKHPETKQNRFYKSCSIAAAIIALFVSFRTQAEGSAGNMKELLLVLYCLNIRQTVQKHI